MTEKTAEIVGNALAQKPSAVVDAMADLITARATALLQAQYQDTASLDEPEEEEEEEEVQPEGEEGNDEEAE